MSWSKELGHPRVHTRMKELPLGNTTTTPSGKHIKTPSSKQIETPLGTISRRIASAGTASTPLGNSFVNNLVNHLATTYIAKSNIDKFQSANGVDTFTGQMGRTHKKAIENPNGITNEHGSASVMDAHVQTDTGVSIIHCLQLD